MRKISENMQHIYRRTPIQNCDIDKVALHHLLLKPGPRPWTRTQKNWDPEKLGKQLDVKKKRLEDHMVYFIVAMNLCKKRLVRKPSGKIVIEAV